MVQRYRPGDPDPEMDGVAYVVIVLGVLVGLAILLWAQ